MHDEAFWVNFSQYCTLRLTGRRHPGPLPGRLDAVGRQPRPGGDHRPPQAVSGLKIVGLCHGFDGVYHLADLLGLDRDEVTFEVPGVNHHVWLTHCYHSGEDVFPLLDDWIATKAPAYWESCPLSDYQGPKAIDLYRRFGVFPIGDTATPGGGAWGWWYHTDDETERRWHEDPAGWYDRHFVRGRGAPRRNPTSRRRSRPPRHRRLPAQTLGRGDGADYRVDRLRHPAHPSSSTSRTMPPTCPVSRWTSPSRSRPWSANAVSRGSAPTRSAGPGDRPHPQRPRGPGHPRTRGLRARAAASSCSNSSSWTPGRGAKRRRPICSMRSLACRSTASCGPTIHEPASSPLRGVDRRALAAS